MKINFPTLSTYVKDIHGIPISAVLRIVHHQWCGPMGVKGFCSEECANCAEHLQKAFEIEGARNAQALLNWTLKNELASVQEETSIHEFVPVKDAFGRPKPQSEDIFGDLAKWYK